MMINKVKLKLVVDPVLWNKPAWDGMGWPPKILLPYDYNKYIYIYIYPIKLNLYSHNYSAYEQFLVQNHVYIPSSFQWEHFNIHTHSNSIFLVTKEWG